MTIKAVCYQQNPVLEVVCAQKLRYEIKKVPQGNVPPKMGTRSSLHVALDCVNQALCFLSVGKGCEDFRFAYTPGVDAHRAKAREAPPSWGLLANGHSLDDIAEICERASSGSQRRGLICGIFNNLNPERQCDRLLSNKSPVFISAYWVKWPLAGNARSQRWHNGIDIQINNSTAHQFSRHVALQPLRMWGQSQHFPILSVLA
ncbi:unnamed protein product [Ixodes pacificus]